MIDTVSFDLFMPDLEPELVRCPVPVIERRLREAAIEACEDANVWQHTITLDLVVDQIEYELIDDDDVDVHSLISVESGSRNLVLGADFHITERGAIVLDRAPKKVSAWTICASLKPTRSALVLGDIIYRNNYRMLIQGALSKAYDMKNRLWSNPTEARKHRAIFEEEIADARREIERGFVTSSHRVMRRFHAAPSQRGYNPYTL